MIRTFSLRSPAYPPGARDFVVAPFPAVLRALRPLERCLIVDVPTRAAFAIERIDELSTAQLYELTGRDRMPDGTPARAVRIALRRELGGEYAQRPAAFNGQLVCEVDAPTMEQDLRAVCVDGFAEARAEAVDKARAPHSIAILEPDAPPACSASSSTPASSPTSAPPETANGKPTN